MAERRLISLRPDVWLPVVTVVALLGLSQAAVATGALPERCAPPPTTIAGRLVGMLGEPGLYAQVGRRSPDAAPAWASRC